MNLKTPGVYVIRNTLTGSCYVGSAINIDQRWRSHRHSLRNHKKSPPKLQAAWDKYGEDAFEFAVLEQCPRSCTLEREQAWIDRLQPKYNTRAQAHSNIGVKWSPQTNASKGRPAAVYTVRGVTGALRMLAKHFGVVTAETARVRMARGAGVEEAVTAAPMDRAARGARAQQTHSSNKTHPRATMYTAQGKTMMLRDLVKELGVVSYTTVRARLRRGWEIEPALSTPLVPYSQRKRPQ
jgi:group I intron endonuclease